jgi:hypothetical protein
VVEHNVERWEGKRRGKLTKQRDLPFAPTKQPDPEKPDILI